MFYAIAYYNMYSTGILGYAQWEIQMFRSSIKPMYAHEITVKKTNAHTL